MIIQEKSTKKTLRYGLCKVTRKFSKQVPMHPYIVKGWKNVVKGWKTALKLPLSVSLMKGSTGLVVMLPSANHRNTSLHSMIAHTRKRNAKNERTFYSSILPVDRNLSILSLASALASSSSSAWQWYHEYNYKNETFTHVMYQHGTICIHEHKNETVLYLIFLKLFLILFHFSCIFSMVSIT